MKVKVRVNIHGIFSVSSASLVEVQKSDETEEPMETEQANDKEGEVCHQVSFYTEHHTSISTIRASVLTQKTHLVFVTPLQSKMQTDQEEQQGQGEGQKETEEKTPRENEEMEVGCSVFV